MFLLSQTLLEIALTSIIVACCSAPTCQSQGIKLQHYDHETQGTGLKEDICNAPTEGDGAIFTTVYPDTASDIYDTMCRLSSGTQYGSLKDFAAMEWENDDFYHLIHEYATNNKYSQRQIRCCSLHGTWF